MPELPEVETIRLGLQKYPAGHKILDIEILHPKAQSAGRQVCERCGGRIKKYYLGGRGTYSCENCQK